MKKKGFAEALKAIKDNSAETRDMSNTYVFPLFERDLLEELKKNTKLKTLILPTNYSFYDISSSGLLQHNTTLTSLTITNSDTKDDVGRYTFYRSLIFKPYLDAKPQYRNLSWYYANKESALKKITSLERLELLDLSICSLARLTVTFETCVSRNNESQDILCCSVVLPNEVIDLLLKRLLEMTYARFANDCIVNMSLY